MPKLRQAKCQICDRAIEKIKSPVDPTVCLNCWIVSIEIQRWFVTLNLPSAWSLMVYEQLRSMIEWVARRPLKAIQYQIPTETKKFSLLMRELRHFVESGNNVPAQVEKIYLKALTGNEDGVLEEEYGTLNKPIQAEDPAIYPDDVILAILFDRYEAGTLKDPINDYFSMEVKNRPITLHNVLSRCLFLANKAKLPKQNMVAVVKAWLNSDKKTEAQKTALCGIMGAFRLIWQYPTRPCMSIAKDIGSCAEMFDLIVNYSRFFLKLSLGSDLLYLPVICSRELRASAVLYLSKSLSDQLDNFLNKSHKSPEYTTKADRQEQSTSNATMSEEMARHNLELFLAKIADGRPSELPSVELCQQMRLAYPQYTKDGLLLSLACFCIETHHLTSGRFDIFPDPLFELIHKHLGSWQKARPETIALGSLQVLLPYLLAHSRKGMEPHQMRIETAIYRTIEFLRQIPREPSNPTRENALSLCVDAYNDLIGKGRGLTKGTHDRIVSYLLSKRITSALILEEPLPTPESISRLSERAPQPRKNTLSDSSPSKPLPPHRSFSLSQSAKASKLKSKKTKTIKATKVK